jgi:hypothetical protein
MTVTSRRTRAVIGRPEGSSEGAGRLASPTHVSILCQWSSRGQGLSQDCRARHRRTVCSITRQPGWSRRRPHRGGPWEGVPGASNRRRAASGTPGARPASICHPRLERAVPLVSRPSPQQKFVRENFSWDPTSGTPTRAPYVPGRRSGLIRWRARESAMRVARRERRVSSRFALRTQWDACLR